MLRIRVIPLLLLRGKGLVKGIGFKDHRYIGDPINAIRIFNEKEVDELMLVDIDATRLGRSIDPEVVRSVSTACFMPLAVGGGINDESQAKALFAAGAEKVMINTAAVRDPQLIRRLAERYGSQSIVVGIDVKSGLLGGRRVYVRGGEESTRLSPAAWAKQAESLGAGEILLTSIDRDGTMKGYDLELVRQVTEAVSVPVIAAGGAGSVEHFAQAVSEGHASAIAAGAMFVFHGRRRAVLISFPDRPDLEARLGPSAHSGVDNR